MKRVHQDMSASIQNACAEKSAPPLCSTTCSRCLLPYGKNPHNGKVRHSLPTQPGIYRLKILIA